MLRFDVFTLFPEMFGGHLSESIIKRAVENSLLDIQVHNIRDYGIGKHRVVDDTPYGGGAGMVMMAPPIFDSMSAVLGEELDSTPVIYLSPTGERFSQDVATELSGYSRIALLCGRYEGVDQRVRDHLVDREISIGDYILTGGELAASVVIDSVARLVPGVIDEESLEHETFHNGLLEYPQYTRPEVFRGWTVPEILLSGHHAKIEEWRRTKSLELTRRLRPDLLDRS